MLRLVVLSPGITRTLSGARVLITLALLALVFMRLGYSLGRFRIGASLARMTLAVLVLLAAREAPLPNCPQRICLRSSRPAWPKNAVLGANVPR